MNRVVVPFGLALGLIAEVALYAVAPGGLATMAFFPIVGAARIRRGLVADTHEASYRDASPAGPDLTRLLEAWTLHGADFDAAADASMHRIVLWLRRSRRRGRIGGVGRLDLRQVADGIEIRSVYVPNPFFTICLIEAVALAVSLPGGPPTAWAIAVSVFVAVLLILLLLPFGRLRRATREIIAELEQRMQPGK